MKILKIALIVFISQAAIAQQPVSSSIEGIAIQSVTNKPLSDVTVELTDSQTSVRVTTDHDGKFLIPDVAPGHYRLFASLNGYVRAEYGEPVDGGATKGMPPLLPMGNEAWRRNHDLAPHKGIDVAVGQRNAALRIVLTPGGVISGRATDRGKPVPELPIHAVKFSYDSDGQPVLSKFLSAFTDDLGEYHIFWLPPGQYYLMADSSDVVRNGYVGFINPTNGAENPLINRLGAQAEMSRVFLPGDSYQPLFLRTGRVSDSEMHVPRFFPNTSDWHEAQIVKIAPGDEVRNINIIADPLPALHIRGTVSGIPQSQQGPTPRVQIALFAADGSPSGNLLTERLANVQSDANGSFDFARVSPGSYFVTVQGGVSGYARVNLRDRDVTVNINALSPQQGLSVSGSTAIEHSDVRPGDLVVGLRMEGTGIVTLAKPASDGTFTIQPVFPDQDYRVFVLPINAVSGGIGPVVPTLPQTPSLQAAYVKSIELGQSQTDLMNDSFHISQSLRQLKITVAGNAGSVKGQVVIDRVPTAGASVVLIPESAQRFHVNHKFTYTNGDGKFEIKGIAPGNYKIFTWESIEPYAWQNADLMRNYESQGTLLHIEEGSSTVVELRPVR
jgi:hypothetical protein